MKSIVLDPGLLVPVLLRQAAIAVGSGARESALCEGVARLPPPHGLPALPRVAFHFLPARRGEADFVGRARELLASHLV